MWGFLFALLDSFSCFLPVIRFLGGLYDIDDRPEARSVTVGCMVLTVFVALVLGVVLAFR
jgi:hypothetical protein